MGNSQSPAPDSRFSMAIRAFSPLEFEQLRSLFVSLAAQSQSGGKFVSPSVFQDYFGIRGSLGRRMFEVATQGRDSGKLSFQDLVVTKAVYEKGTRDEIQEFIYRLCDVTGHGTLRRSDIKSVLASICETLFTEKSSESGLSEKQDIMEAFLNAATFSEDTKGAAERSMSFSDFRCWCSLLPAVRKFLGSLLVPPDSGKPGFQVPHLEYPENINPDVLIMRKEYAWHIGGSLSQRERENWKLLYHSGIDGLSFNTFMGNLSNGEGATILIIRDIEGYVYGGYASQRWERQSDFYGDMKSFLFQLYPQASIFLPSGLNTNLQWFAVNFSSDSIPNGIGFGGRASHFGLFLSASFDQGHTFACTTFNSPCLSKTNNIRPEVIECWGIQVSGLLTDKPEIAEGSILERFREDRNMLKMVGLANASD